MVCPTPFRVRACGRTSAKSGGPNSGCASPCLVCRRLVLARERRLRFGDAVIVFEAVGQKQRAARLLLGILGERNRRRLVGNDVERPGQIVAGAVQRRRAGRRDVEPIFLRAGRRVHVVLRRRDAAFAGDIEIELAGGAHDQRRSRPAPRSACGLAVDLRHFAGMNAGENDRRLAGIRRRRDPGVDAEIRRQHHALPVERGGDALPAFAAGGNEGGDARR